MRKLLLFTCGFVIAVILGIFVMAGNWLWLGAAGGAMLLLLSILLRKRWDKMIVISLLCAGVSLGFLWQMGFEQLYLSTPRSAHQTSGEYTIYVTDYPVKTQYGYAVDGVIFLEGKPYLIQASLPLQQQISPGDGLHASMILSCTLADDSDFDRSKGIFLTATVVQVQSLDHPEKVPWFAWPAMVRQYITKMLQTVFPGDVTAFARALLLGDTANLDYETDTALKLSGIRHIVAVSGLHVSILFSLIFLLTGKRHGLAALLGIGAMLFFAAVVGFAPSIIRACIMHSLMALAMLLRKEYDPLSALSFAVLVMLLINPWTIANVGFQLSLGCVLGILLFASRIQNWLSAHIPLGKGKGIRKKAANWLTMSISVSISAVLLTTPLCAMYFGVVSLVGVVTNLLTLWIVTLCFYGLLLTCLVGMFSATLATAVAWVVAWPMRYVLLMAKALASLPMAAVYTQSVYIVIWLILCYVLLLCYLPAKRKHPLIPACCGIVFLCIALFASWTEPLTDECRVTALDVGQGQCILLQSEGKNFLVDCGGDSGEQAADEAAGLLLSQGISRLDGLILTHFDADHAGGVAYLLSRVPADRLYLPTSLDVDGYRQALAGYTAGQVEWVDTDTTITYGTSKISLIPSEFGSSDNESGLCVLFQTENCDILITGDRGFAGELELMNHMSLPVLELLIVGHHGSQYSTSQELLAVTTPEYAIISVSQYNLHGHPSQEVLDRLAQFGCTVYRTDHNGTVIFRR